jgi:hypothetical protein
MAKVSKRKAKKKVSSLKSEVKTTLDAEDLRQIENLSKDVKIAKLEMHLEEQTLRSYSQEIAILQNKLISQRQVLQEKADRFESRKNKYASYMEEINPKYGLSVGQTLGYNPDTGEIVK